MTRHRMKRINLRLTEAERTEIIRRASRAGLSISEYLRRCALRDRNGPTIDVSTDHLKQLHTDLKRAGNLCNQIARELNTNHRPDAVIEDTNRAMQSLERATDEIVRLIAEAREFI